MINLRDQCRINLLKPPENQSMFWFFNVYENNQFKIFTEIGNYRPSDEENKILEIDNSEDIYNIDTIVNRNDNNNEFVLLGYTNGYKKEEEINDFYEIHLQPNTNTYTTFINNKAHMFKFLVNIKDRKVGNIIDIISLDLHRTYKQFSEETKSEFDKYFLGVRENVKVDEFKHIEINLTAMIDGNNPSYPIFTVELLPNFDLKGNLVLYSTIPYKRYVRGDLFFINKNVVTKYVFEKDDERSYTSDEIINILSNI